MSDEFEKFEMFMKSRPHVVILGAGASCAAIPNGDKNGRKISAMSGFIDKLSLRSIIDHVQICTKSDNLEDIYMELDARGKSEPLCQKVKEELENAIRDYMLTFQIPDEPTIYDFLILSLTKKDLIATFNWDPFIVQAAKRCSRITSNIPKVVFLHGNVAVGYCAQDNIVGNVGDKCPQCGKNMRPIKLLFPIKNKDYSSDPGIKAAWDCLLDYIKTAYMVTIFGYSAPKSDTEAVSMMKKAWGKVDNRTLEEISLIDIREENEVISSWEDFIYSHHFCFSSSFFDSYLGRLPRRTCEATFDRLMKNVWLDTRGKSFSQEMTWEQIEKLIEPLLLDEHEHPMNLSNPYVL